MKLNITSLNYATILTIVLVVILTLGSELSGPFKLLLAGITGHHWVTKGVFSLIFFVISYALISRVARERVDPFHQTIYLIKATILGGMIIFGFYVWHFVS